MKSVSNGLKSLDLIAEIPSARIHFGTPNEHKTVMGGICSIVAILGFLWIAMAQFIPIWHQTRPFINTQAEPFEYYDENNDRVNMSLEEGYKIVV